MATLFNIEQQRAQFALTSIENIRKWDVKVQKEFRSYVQSLPAQIQMNGFGQSMAFVCSKKPDNDKKGSIKVGEKAYAELYELIQNWLANTEVYPQGDLINNICHGDMARYQQATAETQALLVWLKKMARAYLNVSEAE